MRANNGHFAAFPLDMTISEFFKYTLSDLIVQNINVNKYRPDSSWLFKNKT